MEPKKLPNPKDYDEKVVKFIEGDISFEQFVTSTPTIPPPPTARAGEPAPKPSKK